jgi:hypothetical protein
MTYKKQTADKIGCCSPCSAKQEGNKRICWLCRRKNFMPNAIRPAEYLRFMAKRGEDLI